MTLLSGTTATRNKTRSALLGGLRNGKLAKAVDKMEADQQASGIASELVVPTWSIDSAQDHDDDTPQHLKQMPSRRAQIDEVAGGFVPQQPTSPKQLKKMKKQRSKDLLSGDMEFSNPMMSADYGAPNRFGGGL